MRQLLQYGVGCFFIVFAISAIWNYVTLYKMRSQINSKLSPQDQISLFWMGYQFGKIRRSHRTFYPNSALPKFNLAATVLGFLSWLGLGTTMILLSRTNGT
jgi:hypothetical protein